MSGSHATPGSGTVGEVWTAFLWLGLRSFGGPIAHVGYFHETFVDRRRWLDDATFADHLALCQFLPGPASSQLAYAIGAERAGTLGGLAASIAFLLPSAAVMIAVGCGLGAAPDLAKAAWLHGLALAAVAVVAQAVWVMAHTLCPDWKRASLGAIACIVALLAPSAWTQIAIIAGGALVGLLGFAVPVPSDPSMPVLGRRFSRRGGAAALLTFALLLVALPILAEATGARPIQTFDTCYRAGSLVVGGGHVVLPLLRAETIPRGWITEDLFLAGYGAAQALPGPLFSFAGFLGAAIFALDGLLPAIAGGLWCLVAIFLPAWLLIGGALPFWSALRRRAGAQAALRGANAAVVGVLLAAWCTPIASESIRSGADIAIAAVALCLLASRRVPTVAVVAACAVAATFAQ